MQAGKLDRRVTWQHATLTQDGFGGNVETWGTIFETWCGRVDLTGAERLAAAERVDLATLKIRIRYRAEIETVDQFIYEGRIYAVVSIDEIGRREGQEIVGTTRTDVAAMVDT